ncbi:MAG: hypothetical protein ABS86_06065 [Sphingobium sp. SCN 64-10]|nr:MAG: hypothetical protein ABS86_06065 [Sphingobium sp. SCN 64-10]
MELLSDVMESHLDNLARRGTNAVMSSKSESTSARGKGRGTRTRPVWAEGLKRMYDEVVDEKLPDDFLALLKKLDVDSGSK